MSRLHKWRRTAHMLAASAVVMTSLPAAAQDGQQRFSGIGRTATAAELAAWDIDVRPDFKGLPPGSGSVAKGGEVWEAKCASCHGSFGESNEVFTPLIGGTTEEDIRRGRVANLVGNRQPQRTMIMKLSQVSTLWDYIRRAMPWNAPKSLSNEEVYAVTAYVLNMADVVPGDFVLSDRNIAEVQKRLPNRDGMTTRHGLWEVNAKPDVNNQACMRDCPDPGRITSSLPAHARNAHGNLAQQNRDIGPVRGIDTAGGAGKATAAAAPQPAAPQPAAPKSAGTEDASALADRHGCMACHGIAKGIVGPAFADVAKRHGGTPNAVETLAAKIRKGGAGTWGTVPMPPQAGPTDDELARITQWIVGMGR